MLNVILYEAADDRQLGVRVGVRSGRGEEMTRKGAPHLMFVPGRQIPSLRHCLLQRTSTPANRTITCIIHCVFKF